MKKSSINGKTSEQIAYEADLNKLGFMLEDSLKATHGLPTVSEKDKVSELCSEALYLHERPFGNAEDLAKYHDTVEAAWERSVGQTLSEQQRAEYFQALNDRVEHALGLEDAEHSHEVEMTLERA